MHAILDKRRTIKREWCDRQVGSRLIRGPTVDTTLKASHLSSASLKQYDSFALPWALETLEEQVLLSSNCSVAFVGPGQSQCASVISVTSKFIVWTQNKDYDAGSDSEEDDADVVIPEDDDADPHHEDDVTSGFQNLSFSTNTKHSKPPELPEMDCADLDVEILPLATRFHWLRLRTVQIWRVPETDLIKFTCSCGFVYRIGTGCRHMLAVLCYMLLAIASAADVEPVISTIFDGIDLTGFFNMDWCSKIRYHSGIFGADALPPLAAAIPQCYIRSSTLLQHFLQQAELKKLIPASTNENGKLIWTGVPRAGLPLHANYNACSSDDESDEEVDGEQTSHASAGGGAAAIDKHKRPTRFAPTNHNAEMILQKILACVGKSSEARVYVGSMLNTILSEVTRIVQPKAKIGELRRHFTQSDYQHGRPKPGDAKK